MALTIYSPVTGYVSPLDEVPDPVFAGRILGDGVAIDPTEGVVVAPCAGEVSALAQHAVTIRAENGAEILIHVGLETVALKGLGFTPRTELGRKVKRGDALLGFDLNVLADHARSLITPVIIANGDAFSISARTVDRVVDGGSVLFEVSPSSPQAAEETSQGLVATRRVVIASEHGLHARPAAVLAASAKEFSGTVTISCRGRKANAKSPVAVMALGIGHGDEAELSAQGDGAAACLEKLVLVLGQPYREDTRPASVLQTKPAKDGSKLFGVKAAPGRAVGTAVQMHAAELAIAEAGDGVGIESAALTAALAGLKAQIEDRAAMAKGPQKAILSAHLELLADPELEAAAKALIGDGKSAAFAWRHSVRGFADVFRGLSDPRLRERAADLMDLERQILGLLSGAPAGAVSLPPDAILIAREILPSDLSTLDANAIKGLVSAEGGPTSHVAILAASMNIPALVGAGEDVLEIADGSVLLLDADAGYVDTAPDAQSLSAAREEAAAAAQRATREKQDASALAVTADGARIEVFANLAKGAEEASAAVALGAEGCGLLRTEFLFMERETPPSELEQRAAYQAMAETLGGRSFILRTFDIGADKPVAYLSFPHEDNPQLGLRGIRAGLQWPDLFKTQLRAAVQVKPAAQCKILLPMITARAELAAARALLEEVCADLSVPVPALGVMIETPSSAILADQLAQDADFFSIGTNDLTQYTLAIDRTHGTLSKQLDGLHPAVLRLIANTAEAANRAGKMAAVCGGLAADPAAAPVLIGLGVKELSVPAPAIPRLKAQIRTLTITGCQALAAKALDCASAAQVRALTEDL